MIIMENPSFHIEALLHDNERTSDFDGPLSLILQLLHKDKIEIRDISISDILDQYNSYIRMMRETNLEIASEFIQMASYLLYIKTKMMLSGDRDISEMDELIASLEKLQARDSFERLKSVFPELLKMYDYGSGYFCKSPEIAYIDCSVPEYTNDIGSLLESLASVLTRNEYRTVDSESIMKAVPAKLQYSVRAKSYQISELVTAGPTSMSALYSLCSSRSEIIATFISVLELCVLGFISISESDSDYVVEMTHEADVTMIDRIIE